MKIDKTASLKLSIDINNGNPLEFDDEIKVKVSIEYSDVVSYIDQCDQDEREGFIHALGINYEDPATLYDSMFDELISKIQGKITPFELEKRLKDILI